VERIELWGGVFHEMDEEELRLVRPNIKSPTPEELGQLHPNSCNLFERGVSIIGRTWRVCYQMAGSRVRAINFHAPLQDQLDYQVTFFSVQKRYGVPVSRNSYGAAAYAKWENRGREITLLMLNKPPEPVLMLSYRVARDGKM
jgi:hypothetical protein